VLAALLILVEVAIADPVRVIGLCRGTVRSFGDKKILKRVIRTSEVLIRMAPGTSLWRSPSDRVIAKGACAGTDAGPMRQ